MKELQYSSLILGLVFTAISHAVDMEAIPHVGEKATNSFKYEYLYANSHRAFAIAPGGAWSWVADKPTATAAKNEALKACSAYTQQKCVIYALNENIIFNEQEWYKSWGPYKTKSQAKQSATGVLLGQKFPDLLYTDHSGSKKSIHESGNKVRFVHFWGSWCPSCVHELPSLIQMYQIINDLLPGQVEFVLLQVRESIQTSKSWAKTNNIETQIFSDSGTQNEDDDLFRLKTGTKIKDRSLAKVFPSSYVLDKNGIVVFSNAGSIENWNEYIRFIKDVAAH